MAYFVTVRYLETRKRSNEVVPFYWSSLPYKSARRGVLVSFVLMSHATMLHNSCRVHDPRDGKCGGGVGCREGVHNVTSAAGAPALADSIADISQA